MKNIHLLPTDKPSRLLLSKRGNLQFLKDNSSTNFNNHFIGTYQNIYITSDEEIKDVRPHKGKWQLEQGQILNKFPNYLTDLSECKLIILTTNQDLINDGVQAIDDEFLEWFVKNPKCESVEYVGDDCYYEIIIPQEEPKTNLEKLPFPELVKEFVEYYENVPLTEEPKQETLEDELWGNVFAKIKQYGLNYEVLTVLKQNFNISKR